MNYFHRDEIQCKCHCNIYNVEEEHIEILNQIRVELNRKMWVTSGCRCPDHNDAVGGADNSGHITTETNPCTEYDIYCVSGGFRYDLVGLCYKYKVPRIGVYYSSPIVHIGFSNLLPQGTMWVMK